jgi:hypothetical protein
MQASVIQGLLLACIVTPRVVAGAEGPPTPWQVGSPIFTYGNYMPPEQSAATVETHYGWPAGYDPTSLTPEVARQSVAGGFNLVWINDLSQLPIAESYGLRAQYVISGHQPQNNLFFVPAMGWPEISDIPTINELIDRFKASSAAYSYFVVDEPGASRFPQLAATVSYIRRRDPAHLACINLPPDEVKADLETADYGAYVEAFIRAVRPTLL